MGWFGNKSAIEAVDRAQGEVFASVIDKDGNPGYWSLLIVNKDSDLKTLDDVLKRGGKLSYGAGDPNSTSGTAVVPGYHPGAEPARSNPRPSSRRCAPATTKPTCCRSSTSRWTWPSTNTGSALERCTARSTGKDASDSVRVLWKSPLIRRTRWLRAATCLRT